MQISKTLTFLVLLVGCVEESAVEPEYQGAAIFFNFYDEPVELYLDDELLLAETLEVSDDSTGFSKEVALTVRGCSKLEVVATPERAELEICPDSSGFGVWVSPEHPSGRVMIDFEPTLTSQLD